MSVCTFFVDETHGCFDGTKCAPSFRKTAACFGKCQFQHCDLSLAKLPSEQHKGYLSFIYRPIAKPLGTTLSSAPRAPEITPQRRTEYPHTNVRPTEKIITRSRTNLGFTYSYQATTDASNTYNYGSHGRDTPQVTTVYTPRRRPTRPPPIIYTRPIRTRPNRDGMSVQTTHELVTLPRSNVVADDATSASQNVPVVNDLTAPSQSVVVVDDMGTASQSQSNSAGKTS